MAEVNPIDDPAAMMFVSSCLQCHPGTLTQTELINTPARSVDNLDKAVRRMQQYTGPFTETQIADLVELMKDQDFVMRVEEAKLAAEEAEPVAVNIDAVAASDDLAAKLYISKCASVTLLVETVAQAEILQRQPCGRCHSCEMR
jgi:hypothetical protein